MFACGMPGTNAQKIALISRAVGCGRLVGCLERVHTSPQMGVVSAGTFMRNYGQLEMLLDAAQVFYFNPTPQTWQKVLKCRTAGDKNVSLRAARALFPRETITHKIADALLLAEYCRRVHQSLGS